MTDAERLAREVFGWPGLRPGQRDAVQALTDGRDVLVVMPTGAGKSAVYQLAALTRPGPTVVVSPLIALQRDQAITLAATGERRAVAVTVNSAQPAAETEQAWQALAGGAAEFVFLAPEQLARPEVVDRLAAARPSLLVVDEAHCVSSWGHDFRPEYLRIADAVDQLPGPDGGRPPIAALTATAAPPVRDEILLRLRIPDALQVVHGFDRPNLWPAVERFVTDRDKRLAVVERTAAARHPALLYTATRRNTVDYAQALRDKGLRAAAYHAGLPAAERREVHEQFLAGDLDVVTATSAFGMGIDKPDVRTVLHADVADSIDSYYQEIGRAGRDGEPAQVLLLYRPEDLGLRRFLSAGHPDRDVLATVLAAVRHQGPDRRGRTRAALSTELDLRRAAVTTAVNLLEQAGLLSVGTRGRLRPLAPDVPAAAAVERAAEVAEQRRTVERSRLEMMRGYAETTGCRRRFLLGYFGEDLPEPCGSCDTCASGPIQKVDRPDDGTGHRFAAQDRVEHREWGPGVVMQQEPDRLTVLFEQAGYRTLALDALSADPDLLRPLRAGPRAPGARAATSAPSTKSPAATR